MLIGENLLRGWGHLLICLDRRCQAPLGGLPPSRTPPRSRYFGNFAFGGNARTRSGPAGFPQVNVDLIAGMMDETEDNWQSCVAKTIEMQPDSVTIYQMEIPYNTTIYKQMKDASKQEAPVADWATKRRWVSYAFDEFEKAGYTVTSAYTVVKDPQNTTFVYRDELWKGADLMSIGVASFGHLGHSLSKRASH